MTMIKIADLVAVNVPGGSSESFAAIWLSKSLEPSEFLVRAPTGLEGIFDSAAYKWTSSNLSTAAECAVEEWFEQHKPEIIAALEKFLESKSGLGESIKVSHQVELGKPTR